MRNRVQDTIRWTVCSAVTALSLTLLTGCPAPTAPGSGGTAPGTPPFRAALVLDTGGVDDKSFNAAAYAGLQRAKTELKLGDNDVSMVESKSYADYKTNLSAFAGQGYSIVFAVGYKMEDALKEVAPQFPKVKFAIVDGNAPAGAPNCAALQFSEEQGTFLAGFLAGSVSKTHKLGFVGGEDIPLIRKFEAGYRAGAKTAGLDPERDVVHAYTGDWNDLSKGKSMAEQEFSAGADIVFAAAGKGGLGVIAAAKSRGAGFYAIGVDQDQDDVAPGFVLTSMVKHVDTAVFDTIKRTRDNQFQSGTVLYDINKSGVGLSDLRFTRDKVPAPILDKLARLRAQLADGTVKPPTTLDQVKSFKPPTL